MVQLELWQGIINGFATGIGVGLANWIAIKRLENLEKKMEIKFKTNETNKG